MEIRIDSWWSHQESNDLHILTSYMYILLSILCQRFPDHEFTTQEMGILAHVGLVYATFRNSMISHRLQVLHVLPLETHYLQNLHCKLYGLYILHFQRDEH
jgi:hypothetical protein